MNLQLKSFLIFLAIFVIGFGSGFLVSGRLTKRSIEAAKERETPVGFKKDLYQYLKADAMQKQAIDSILAEYIPKIKEERAISRAYQKHLRDSMFLQIQQLLDNKQKGELKEFEKEKILKTPKTIIAKAKEKDTASKKNTLKIIKQKQFERFKESLTPEQKENLDSMIDTRKNEPKNPEMQKEIRLYTRSKIYPTLIEYRSKFDEELTPKEQELIQNLRDKRRTMVKAELLGQSLNEEDENTIMDAKKELQNIISNHKQSLEKIANELKPNRDKWDADIDAIKQKYIADYSAKKFKSSKQIQKNVIEFLLLNPDRKPVRGRR